MTTREHPLFYTFKNMKERCTQPSNKDYENYGGRGIEVCERWREYGGFWNFVKDMGAKPSPQHTLDRIDNNGNYEPANCKWSNQSQQKYNTRTYKTNTSGVRGVCFIKNMNKWLAYIHKDCKRVNLGYYANFEEAVLARKLAESQHIDIASNDNDRMVSRSLN